jgi:CheY-like chemotaxis protein
MRRTVPSLRGKRILVLEGDAETGDRLRRDLVRRGAHVVGPAKSAVEALDLIDTWTPNGALLDIRMDAETSFAVAELLWGESVPFVLMSSGDTVGTPPEFQDRVLAVAGSMTLIVEKLFGDPPEDRHGSPSTSHLRPR